MYPAVSLFLHIGGAVFLLSKAKTGFLYLYQKFRILVISTGTTILFVVFCDPGFAVKVDHSCVSTYLVIPLKKSISNNKFLNKNRAQSVEHGSYEPRVYVPLQTKFERKKSINNFQYKKINSAGSSPAMSMRAHTHNKYIFFCSFFPRKTWIGMWYGQIQSCDGKNTIFFVDMWMYRKKER